MSGETLLYMRLKERAARCRDMARRSVSAGITRELESIAAEYEHDAEKLETRSQRREHAPAAA